MLTVKEIKGLAKKLARETFCEQLGPFALIQRPLGEIPGLDQFDLPMKATRTLPSGLEAIKTSDQLVRDFASLSVTTLPPLESEDELTVGRLPSCDLFVDHPSVSKRHAVLRWNAAERKCTVRDLGSTNGTRIDSDVQVRGTVPVRDGDVLTFGEVHFWYLLTETLHDKLSKG